VVLFPGVAARGNFELFRACSVSCGSTIAEKINLTPGILLGDSIMIIWMFCFFFSFQLPEKEAVSSFATMACSVSLGRRTSWLENFNLYI